MHLDITVSWHGALTSRKPVVNRDSAVSMLPWLRTPNLRRKRTQWKDGDSMQLSTLHIPAMAHANPTLLRFRAVQQRCVSTCNAGRQGAALPEQGVTTALGLCIHCKLSGAKAPQQTNRALVSHRLTSFRTTLDLASPGWECAVTVTEFEHCVLVVCF